MARSTPVLATGVNKFPFHDCVCGCVCARTYVAASRRPRTWPSRTTRWATSCRRRATTTGQYGTTARLFLFGGTPTCGARCIRSVNVCMCACVLASTSLCAWVGVSAFYRVACAMRGCVHVCALECVRGCVCLSVCLHVNVSAWCLHRERQVHTTIWGRRC